MAWLCIHREEKGMMIAHVEGLKFKIPEDAWFSFFNSPYPGHGLGTAVDVYFSDKALFPLEEGRVAEIRRIRTPRYVPVREDYLIIIEAAGFCLKVLHVMPSVRTGEKLGLYDEIGSLIVSGFFSPWSDRHAHFELRDCGDRYRARGGFLMNPKILKLVPVVRGNEFEVVEKNSRYLWLKPVRRGGRNLTPVEFRGIPVEGGLPHYRHGAVFGHSEEVEIFGLKVPVDKSLPNGTGLFEARFRVLANGQEVRGAGIYCNQERIKLIGGNFEEGDVVEVKLGKLISQTP